MNLLLTTLDFVRAIGSILMDAYLLGILLLLFNVTNAIQECYRTCPDADVDVDSGSLPELGLPLWLLLYFDPVK